ncbi:hypothetical protein LJC36_02520 [Desulfovibrio sp. OttesenSCG-928-C14]|nr:hypothetical protein [Desulfovibrio sp. OttesenSCG-928-C14]
MPESTFTIRVDEELKSSFTEAARISDRTGAQLIRDFMREYVQTAREREEYEIWFRKKVEAGLKDRREGRVLTGEEVEERARLRRERLIAKHGAQS